MSDNEEFNENQQRLLDAVSDYFDATGLPQVVNQNIQIGGIDEESETIVVLQAYRCSADRYEEIAKLMAVFKDLVNGKITVDNIDKLRPKKLIN